MEQRTRPGNMKKIGVVIMVMMCVLLVVFRMQVAELFIPCPSRSEIEAQLKDFTRFRTVQSESDKEAVMRHLIGKSVAWDSPDLVSAVRQHFIDTPRPYVTKFSLPLTQTPQAKAADAILKAKQGGFFVECGGLDGERSSNTLWLEQKRGWTGLLVEMDPSYYMQLRGKNRKCFSINACLSPNMYPDELKFKEHAMGEGKLSSSAQENTISTYCFPFNTIMKALNRTKIDYFSLDVEGFEHPILRTIDFDRVFISVISVEITHSKGGGKPFIDFFKSKGFTFHSHLRFFKKELYLGGNDYMFINDKLL